MSKNAAVNIKGVNFFYEKEHQVLNNVSLDIRAGERFGILGPSGAGKSTLLLHLNGILRGRGEIIIGDLPLRDDTLPAIRGKVGLVFQNPDDQLFNPTVEEDIAFGPLNMGMSREEAIRRVKKSLKLMRLEGFERKSSHHLSFGERKRVALATVLAMQPEVIAFDEPFSNLDPGMVLQLMELIQKLDSTVIMVSQEILPAVACCDRLAVLQGGEVAAVGTADDIARDQDLLRRSSLDISFYFDICDRLKS